MKQFLALLAALVFVVVAPVHAEAKSPDVVQVTITRSLEVTLHADTAFTPSQRVGLEVAAERWRTFTNGRVDLRVAYDLDFESTASVVGHAMQGHPMIVAARSGLPIVRAMDKQLGGPNRTILAVTASYPYEAVYMILDRIDPSKFRQIAQHEFGHVAGLDDLDDLGAIMSGNSTPRVPDATEFTPRDREFCRAERYCD